MTGIQGNTPAVVGTGAYAANFNPIVGSGSVTYTLDSFPLYNGAFPIKLAGEYMNNPGASSNNEGWWGGVTFGKAGKKGTWDLSYRYQRLEADAWWDQVVNDDNHRLSARHRRGWRHQCQRSFGHGSTIRSPMR